MNTTELQHELASTEDDPGSSSNDPNHPDALKRQCIAGFMDRHPEAFPPPEAAVTWLEFVEQRCVPQGRDQLTLDMAIGRLIQVMRSAQDGIPDRADLSEFLRKAEEQGGERFEPDAAVQRLASPDAAEEDVQVMARAMSMYKTCLAEGVAQGDEITNAIHAGFDHVPATSPFMRSLIETAKEVTLIDVRYALGLAS
ncbi:hypothetical protein SAMN05216359_10239 [Roseateles sp. YR242]|uniref:hypothetical protein n=1 Tax=Roseateles sp. YR242 TaxID=1855305 RepID=UPI0008BECA18|nr:hypothetical protein [Roseateles sp. YR242]SEK51261.1 hypothetical protein SAMN05216359_10239 [Roseateles sp. YR242]